MNASQKCVDLIKYFEGFRSNPYLCPAGVPTIGYGSTRYANGTPVSLSDGSISEADAEVLLLTTLNDDYAPTVTHYINQYVNQDQFDALCDFCYNCGAQNLKSSTLLTKVNAGDFNGAALEFGKWTHANGVVMLGLVNRREAERKLFCSEV